MFKKIFYFTVIASIIVLIIGFLLPRRVHVESSIEIARPAATVFTVLNSYRMFHSWSPWAQRDPEATYRLSGPATGSGARMNWSGDPRLVGAGWQEIIESRPYSMVRMRVVFEGHGAADSYFHLQPDARTRSTEVRWVFDMDLVAGRDWFSGLLARYFGLLFDNWIGADYRSGLLRLKELVEAMPAADFSGVEVEMVQLEPQDILFIRTLSTRAPAPSGAGLGVAFRELSAFLAEHHIERAAPPLTIARRRDSGAFAVDAAIPVVSANVDLSGRIRSGRLPGGRALRAIHHGSTDGLPGSYDKLTAWVSAHGMAGGQVAWEQYVSNPRETASEDQLIHIYFMLEDGL